MSIPAINTYSLPSKFELPTNRVNWQPDAQRGVLLIHDMQDYFLRFYGENNPLVDNLINNIAIVRRWAKAAGVPIVYTAQPEHQSLSERALLNDVWGPGLTAADPALKAIVSDIAPDADDTVLVKWRYSAFQRSNLELLMQQWGRDQLYIVGVYAHIGCMTTALDAFMRDIQPFMLADAVADFSEAEHRMALDYIAGRCGAVISHADLQVAGRELVTREWLATQIRQLVDDWCWPQDASENLMDFGLDSVQVMQLTGRLHDLGVNVMFEQLADDPRFNHWWQAIEKALMV